MIQRISLSLIIIALLFGCAKKEFTKEEKEEMRREIIAYNSEVVAPILFLSFAACAEYKDSSKWPQIPPSLGPSTPFSTFKSQRKDDYQSLLRLKSSNLLWSLHSALIVKDGEKHCQSTIQAGNDNNSNIFQYKSSVPFSQIDKDNWKDSTYDKFAQSTVGVTTKAYPFLFLVEKNRPQRTQDETDKFISFLNSVMLNVTICAILDIAPNQCALPSQHRTSNSAEEKTEIRKKMERMKEKMNKMLREKLNSTENSAT